MSIDPQQLKVAELKKELKKRGVTPGALKRVMVGQLTKALKEEEEEATVPRNKKKEQTKADRSAPMDLTSDEVDDPEVKEEQKEEPEGSTKPITGAKVAHPVTVKIDTGRKKKTRKFPSLLDGDEFKQAVQETFPELKGKEWHCVSEDGSWIEDKEDWDIAVESWKALQKEDKFRKLSLTVSLDSANTCLCQNCHCQSDERSAKRHKSTASSDGATANTGTQQSYVYQRPTQEELDEHCKTQILDVLKQHKIPATPTWIQTNMTEYPKPRMNRLKRVLYKLKHEGTLRLAATLPGIDVDMWELCPESDLKESSETAEISSSNDNSPDSDAVMDTENEHQSKDGSAPEGQESVPTDNAKEDDAIETTEDPIVIDDDNEPSSKNIDDAEQDEEANNDENTNNDES